MLASCAVGRALEPGLGLTEGNQWILGLLGQRLEFVLIRRLLRCNPNRAGVERTLRLSDFSPMRSRLEALCTARKPGKNGSNDDEKQSRPGGRRPPVTLLLHVLRHVPNVEPGCWRCQAR